MDIDAKVQYRTSDFLKTRIRTHLHYSVDRTDLDDHVRDALRLEGSESLLEIGCGTGGFPRRIRKWGHDGFIAGLDQSPAMIAESEANARKSGAKASWLVGDANALPFGDGVFDGTIARHMLYHVPDIPGALEELKRVLMPDGWAFFATNSRVSLPRIAELMRDMKRNFGFSEPESRIVDSFCIENAKEILEKAFDRMDETIIENALRFVSPDPIYDYASTLLPSVTAEDEALRQSMLDWLKREIPARLSQCGGEWLDPKLVGFYRCWRDA